MRKRALTILLCATLILSLAACGGGQSGGNSTEPPSNSTSGTQQTVEPTTPPPNESDKTPDTTEPQDTETTEPQDTETVEPSKSGGLTDKTPLYLGGDIAVTVEDFDLSGPDTQYTHMGLIEFEDPGIVGEITVHFTNGGGFSYVPLSNHEITLGTDTATVMDIYEQQWEQFKEADDYFSRYTFDIFLEAYQSREYDFGEPLVFVDAELSGEDLLNAPLSEVDMILVSYSESYSINDGAAFSLDFMLDFMDDHDISDVVEQLGVPKYALVDGYGGNGYASVDMYLWDAGDYWLAARFGYFVYFSKSLSADMMADMMDDPYLRMVLQCLDGASQ